MALLSKKDSVTVKPTIVKYAGFTARPNAAGATAFVGIPRFC
jgi:hypothetical protein